MNGTIVITDRYLAKRYVRSLDRIEVNFDLKEVWREHWSEPWNLMPSPSGEQAMRGAWWYEEGCKWAVEIDDLTPVGVEKYASDGEVYTESLFICQLCGEVEIIDLPCETDFLLLSHEVDRLGHKAAFRKCGAAITALIEQCDLGAVCFWSMCVL